MALVYNVEYKNSTKIGNHTIKFRAWSTKDEKDYLIAKDSLDEINDSMLYDMLVLPCLENKELSLSPIEKKKLIIEIRKVSLGSTFPMKYACKKCKNINDLDVELDDIITYKEPKYSEIKAHGMVFHLTSEVSSNLYKRLEETDNLIDKAFLEFLIHIESIEIDGKLEDDFSFDELYQFMNDLPSSIFDDIFPKFREMKGTLEFSLTTFCMVCNEKNLVDFDHLPNFLWT